MYLLYISCLISPLYLSYCLQKFIMATYFFFIFLIISTKTLAYDDSCAFNSKKGNSDLTVIHIYGKCSPFNSPKPSSSWINTVINMASKDPQRLSYLSSLVVSKKPTNVPIASGQQLFNIGIMIFSLGLFLLVTYNVSRKNN